MSDSDPKEEPVPVINTIKEYDDGLSKKTRWFLMWDISIIHGLMCIASGMLSSCITQMREELNLTDKEFGMFGTINGLGSLLGSLAFTIVIERVNHKTLITSMLIINCICHFAFYFKMAYGIMMLSRFISGFVCVFCFIYYPMWVDKFGVKNWVNFMQTTVQVSNTLGAILGYLIYLLLGAKRWADGFLIESVSIGICVSFMLVTPSKYFDKNYVDREREEKHDESNSSKNQVVEKETVYNDIICNIPYIFITLYRGNRFFIYVAICYWYADYIEFSLLEKSPQIIFWSYSITMVISSLIGNILGGVIINLIGGPNSKHLYVAMFALQLLSVLFGIFSPMKNSVLYFSVLMSMYIFVNSASGIVAISASFAVMPKTLTGTAIGLYSLVVNLIAFLPAPYAYAFIKGIVGSGSKVMFILMLYGLFGCFELAVADIYMRINKKFIHKEKFNFSPIKEETKY